MSTDMKSYNYEIMIQSNIDTINSKLITNCSFFILTNKQKHENNLNST